MSPGPTDRRAPPRILILCLAPALRQSQELFAKIAGFYRELGRPVPLVAEQRLGLELTNGSRIFTLLGSEKTTRGFSGVDLLLLDEAARIEDQLYYSVRPVLAVSGGSIVLISTPYGRRRVFYEAWESEEPWERYTVPATEVPRISPEFLEEERLALGEWFYAQEYFCEFMDTAFQVFMTEDLEAIASDEEPMFGPEDRFDAWRRRQESASPAHTPRLIGG